MVKNCAQGTISTLSLKGHKEKAAPRTWNKKSFGD